MTEMELESQFHTFTTEGFGLPSSCVHLQISVSYWSTEIVFMWGSQWEMNWKICVAEGFKPCDPEYSIVEVMLEGCVLNLYPVPCIAIYHIQISVPGQNTQKSEWESVAGFVFVDSMMVVGRQKIGLGGAIEYIELTLK
jgi:hypothetical protein